LPSQRDVAGGGKHFSSRPGCPSVAGVTAITTPDGVDAGTTATGSGEAGADEDQQHGRVGAEVLEGVLGAGGSEDGLVLAGLGGLVVGPGQDPPGPRPQGLVGGRVEGRAG